MNSAGLEDKTFIKVNLKCFESTRTVLVSVQSMVTMYGETELLEGVLNLTAKLVPKRAAKAVQNFIESLTGIGVACDMSHQQQMSHYGRAVSSTAS